MSSFVKYRDMSSDEEEVEGDESSVQTSDASANQSSVKGDGTDEDTSFKSAKPRKNKSRVIQETDSESDVSAESENTFTSDKKESGSDSDSSDEEFIVRKTANLKKRPIVSSDDEDEESTAATSRNLTDIDDDEEERKIERRALSPSTRRSMGFPRRQTMNHSMASSLEDVDSDDDDDDSDNIIHSTEKNAAESPEQRFGDDRMSNNFKKSVLAKMSSTMSGVEKLESSPENSQILSEASIDRANSSDDSVIVLPKQENVYVISSSDDDEDSVVDRSNKESPLKMKTPKKLIQPKLETLLSKTPLLNPKTLPKKQYVSQQVFSAKMVMLDQKRADLQKYKHLSQHGNSLPDKGLKLKRLVDELTRECKILAEDLATCAVEEKENIPTKKNPNISVDNSPDPWKQIQQAANEIMPKYTGKVGMANFNAQKAMTLDRLKDLHGSMETCPNSSVLADEPAGLKISLMPHQRHALAWMQWRERQKPRGGILADDMGLGKTLTMITLVLAANQAREENENESSEDEEDEPAQKSGWTEKGSSQYHYGGTLVVCPASLIRQWESEVNNRIKSRRLEAHVYHGTNRTMRPKQLAKFDIVITTYNLASREAKNEDTLFKVKWDRVILDEAHIIRNHKAQTSVGVCKLRSKYRWALTGTPIQNKEMDVYALLKFLKCTPFDDLAHYKQWIETKSAGGQQRLNTLIQTIMLRRTKAQLQDLGQLQGLPQKELKVIEFSLDKEEMMVYQRIMTFSRTLFSMYLHQRAERDTAAHFTNAGNQPAFLRVKDPNGAYQQMHQRVVQLTTKSGEVQAHVILMLLLRLRQICCHPGLIDAMLDDPDLQSQSPNVSTEDQPELDLLSQLDKLSIDPEVGNTSSDDKAITKAFSNALVRTNAVFSMDRASSKIKNVLKIIDEIYKDKEAYDKVIVVSQWTSVLNLLQDHLRKRGISNVRITGDVPINSRNDIVVDFNKKSRGDRVMLLSLTAGGVGLNLVGANHLILVDVHWNPQLEAQAQDRIFRVGQEKKVVIYKVIASGTIEERIKALQDAKLSIADGVLTGVQSNKGSKLSIDDLKNLFEF